MNGVSDHDAQLLTISTDYSYVPTHRPETVRKINNCTISDFIDKLSCESWDSIFNSEDVNAMLNSFLNIYLRIFYSSFTLKKVTVIIMTVIGLHWALKHHVDTRENCIL